jgi:hypothetical protein
MIKIIFEYGYEKEMITYAYIDDGETNGVSPIIHVEDTLVLILRELVNSGLIKITNVIRVD